MPIYDGSLGDHYHRQNRIRVTPRIRAELAVNNPEELPNWFQAPPVHLQMHRRAYQLARVDAHNASTLIRTLKLNSSQNILIYGGTFGWLGEQLKALLPGIQVSTAESSPWINSVKDQDESGDIEAALDIAGVTSTHKMRQQFFDKLIDGPRAREVITPEDALDNGSRQKIRNLGSFNYIITKNVLSWLHDDEAQNLSSELRKINVASEIVHFVMGYDDKKADKPEPGEILNWKRTDPKILLQIRAILEARGKTGVESDFTLTSDERGTFILDWDSDVLGVQPSQAELDAVSQTDLEAQIKPVVDKLNDLSWYTTPSWQELLPNDRIIGV